MPLIKSEEDAAWKAYTDMRDGPTKKLEDAWHVSRKALTDGEKEHERAAIRAEIMAELAAEKASK